MPRALPEVPAPVVVAVAAKKPAPVLQVVFAKAKIYGGYGMLGKVKLGKAAGRKGLVVKLKAGPGTKVPKSVKVPKYSRSVLFKIRTDTVSKKQIMAVRATARGKSVVKKFAAYPLPTVNGFKVKPATVVGGDFLQGAVSINGPAEPKGTVVKLKSGSPYVEVDPTVEIPAGDRWTSFDIVTNPVTKPTKVEIYAKRGKKLWTARFTLNPADGRDPLIESLKLDKAEVGAGEEAKATVTLDQPAPEGGQKVTFASNSPLVTVQGEAVVPAGQTAATVPVKAGKDINAVVYATISASTNGTTNQTTLKVNPAAVELGALILDPAEAVGGATVTATFKLGHPLGAAANAKVTFTGGVAEQNVALAAGADQGGFTFVVPNADGEITVTVTLGASTAKATVKVKATP